MGLLFFDGFETVGTETGLANEATVFPRIDQRYDRAQTGGTASTTGFSLRDDQFGEGFAWNHGINRPNSLRVETAVEADETYIVGCWVHVQDTTLNDLDAITILTTLSGEGENHIGVRIVDNTDLLLFRDPNTTQLARVNDVITPGKYHYIEIKCVIDNTAGSAEVRVDGVTQITVSSVDTQNFSSTVVGVQFGQMTLFGPVLTDVGQDFVALDDIYILKVDGSAPDDFLGPRTRIKSLPPEADNLDEWDTTSSGTDHSALIDENGADDTDYVETTTDTDRDEFDLTDVTESEGTFHAIKIEAEATDEGDTNNTLDVEVESGGSRSQSSFTVSDPADTVYVHYATTDPQGGGVWILSRVNAMRAGIEFNT